MLRKSLLKDIKTITLSEIPSLASPSMKRAYDGARHSKLSIYSEDKSYEHLFDDESPHALLAPLLQCIITLSKN